MKKIIIILIILINVLSLYSQQDSLKRNVEWLNIDKKNFIELSKFILNKNYSLYNFRKIKNVQINEVYDILLGSRLIASQDNGYTKVKLNLITLKNKIYYLKATLDSSDTEVIMQLAKENKTLWNIVNKWQIKKIKGRKQLVYIFEDSNMLQKDYRLLDKFLGKKKDVNFKKKKTKKAYEILMYPTNIYPYAYKISPTEYVPEGRKAIEYLIKEKEFVLIENVLKGYNPEGRIYAYEALRKSNNLSTDIQKTVSNLKKLPVQIINIYGCLPHRYFSKDIIKKINDYYIIKN